MRFRSHAAVLVLAAFAAPVLANPGGGSRPDPMPSSSTDFRPSDEQTPRQKAEQLYGDAYDDVARGNNDLKDNKAKNAEKKFRRALDRATQATQLDSMYFEAWNLVGYTSRRLGDYSSSFAAYARCLKVKPDYAPAREYLGEALAEQGRIAEARTQLAWLDHAGNGDEAKAVGAAIGAWQSAHPDSGAAHPDAAPARADSSAHGSGSGSGAEK